MYICKYLVIKLSNVLSKFTILCWAAFIAILGCVRPADCRLDTPASECAFRNSKYKKQSKTGKMMGTARVTRAWEEGQEHGKERIEFPRINFFTYCLFTKVTQKPVV